MLGMEAALKPENTIYFILHKISELDKNITNSMFHITKRPTTE